MIAVPFTEELLTFGLNISFAIKLYEEGILSMEKAAKLANLRLEEFIVKLGHLSITAVDYTNQELEQELKDFG